MLAVPEFIKYTLKWHYWPINFTRLLRGSGVHRAPPIMASHRTCEGGVERTRAESYAKWIAVHRRRRSPPLPVKVIEARSGRSCKSIPISCSIPVRGLKEAIWKRMWLDGELERESARMSCLGWDRKEIPAGVAEVLWRELKIENTAIAANIFKGWSFKTLCNAKN